jgi:hypothetical protein
MAMMRSPVGGVVAVVAAVAMLAAVCVASPWSGVVFPEPLRGGRLAEFLHYPTHSRAPTGERFREWIHRVHSALQPHYSQGIAAQALRDNSSDPYFAFIPTFVGAAVPPAGGAGAAVNFTGRCFSYVVTLEQFGYSQAELVVSASALPASDANAACEEVVMLATMDGVHFVVANATGDYTLPWQGAFLFEYRSWIERNGFRVFLWPCEPEECLEEIYATADMFVPALVHGPGVPDETAQRNLAFLRDRAYYDMPARSVHRIDLNETQINSGDFIGVIRLDGLDPMLAWAMGSHTGHTTIALWIDGELYVCESTTNSAYWPTNGIQMTPFKTWMDQAFAADYNAVHLPLSAAARAKFNTTAAVEWFFSTAKGLPYGCVCLCV